MSILRALARKQKQVADADRMLKIEPITFKDFLSFDKGFKTAELQIMSGHAGTGKSFAAQQIANKMLAGGRSIFDADPRLSAIARDGLSIEINYRNYEPANIPGLLDWCSVNGVGDYSVSEATITFVSDVDADLFWMTFVNLNGSRFMHTKGNLDEISRQVKDAKADAIRTGSFVVMDYEGKKGLLGVNRMRRTEA